MSSKSAADDMYKLWERLFVETIAEWPGFVEQSARFVVVRRGLFVALTYADQDRDVMLHLHNDLPELILHLVKIRIGIPMRGSGLGNSLYEAVIKFGKSVGMRYVHCYPAGLAIRSEHEDKSRKQYLARRGWNFVSRDSDEMRIKCS